MSRANPPSSFFTSKALSLRSSALSGRSSPSSSLHSAPGGVATFISSRNHRPPPFQQRRHPTDPGSSDEPDESGGVGVGGVGVPHYRRYESDEEEDEEEDEEGDDTASSVPPLPEDDTYDDSRSATSRASTPRQLPFPQKLPPPHPPQQGQAMRIPDFQQIFSRDDVFDDDKTPSFDESTVMQPPPGRMMEHMRLPLPMGGAGDSPAPWSKREGSEEATEVKPETFMTQQQQLQQQQGRSGFEKITNTEMRLEVAAYDDEEEEVRGGRGKRAPASEGEYRQETEDSYAVKQGREGDEEDVDYYTNDYTDGSDYDEQELERKAGPGIWSEGSPTMSSRGWSRAGSRSKGSPENVPPQRKVDEPRYNANGKGKGKSRERRDQAYGAQRLDFRPSKPTVLPLAVRRPAGDPVLDLQLSPRAHANLAIQPTTNTEIAVIPERKSKAEQPRRMITTSSTDIDLHGLLLPDTELAQISTYTALLARLGALRAQSHAAIPATQLPGELDALARAHYPHDPRRPERFFNRLDDGQHALAGEYILARKRDMEQQLQGVVAKRRRVCEGMMAELEGVAGVRVEKLRRTEERREMLKGGVGRMLREAGLWL